MLTTILYLILRNKKDASPIFMAIYPIVLVLDLFIVAGVGKLWLSQVLTN